MQQVLTAILIFIPVLLHGQNLIPNPGFEDYRKCPKALGQIDRSIAWHSPSTATPDYFNACFQRNQHTVGVPNNYFSTRAAFEGDAYAGIYSGKEETEYLQIKLVEPLVQGRQYCLRLRATAPSFKSYALDAIGIVFSELPFEKDNWNRMEDVQESKKLNFIQPLGATEWVLMTTSFVAKGGESHLVMGYFSDPGKIAYTFFDEIELYEMPEGENCSAEEFTGIVELDHNNFVPNPGFEFMTTCPEAREHLRRARSWRVAENSPDFYHICGSGTAAVPQNELGNQTPHSGEGYGGFWAYLASRGCYREFVSVTLKQPLEAGKEYCTSIWLSLADRSGFALTELQVQFLSDQSEEDANPVTMYYEGPIQEKEGWVFLYTKFVAKGGENAMLIGNFRANDDPAMVLVDAKVKANDIYGDGCYYYVDDVGLHELGSETCPCEGEATVFEDSTPDVDTLPEPLTEEWKVGDTLTLEGILFDFDDIELKTEAIPTLDSLSAYLEKHLELKVRIEGHTDDFGKASYNLRLSEGRAETIAKYLRQGGLAEERLEALGKGEAEPVSDNSDEEGRQRNRRVEVHFLSE